jgi:hypothetical protein
MIEKMKMKRSKLEKNELRIKTSRHDSIFD